MNESIKAYHTSNNKFKKFDASFIGTGAGNSFGNGFYFSDVPISEYGNTINVTLNINNPYEFDYLNDNDVLKFLNDCGCTDIYFKSDIPKEDRKWSISKSLRESNKEDLQELKKLGYDSLIIHNTEVGIKDKKKINSEYVVFNEEDIVIDESLRESLLAEAKRQDLINKSKNADNYSPKNQAKGKNRWERRRFSSISNTVKEYNDINMDAFFKGDILEFGIKVHGETDDYIVTITFEGILKELQREVKANNNVLNFKCVLRALMMSFNNRDVYVSCTCPDFKYRQAFWATQGRYNSGTPQMDNGMRIANPNDTKGAGCKHILLVLSNMDWMMKIASVINNYIRYSRDYLQRNYADYIFPVVYGVPYKRAVQMSIFDKEDEFGDAILPTDKKTIDDVIASSQVGRDEKGKFNKENPFKFKSQQNKENDLIDYSKDDENQMTIDFEEEETK